MFYHFPPCMPPLPPPPPLWLNLLPTKRQMPKYQHHPHKHRHRLHHSACRSTTLNGYLGICGIWRFPLPPALKPSINGGPFVNKAMGVSCHFWNAFEREHGISISKRINSSKVVVVLAEIPNKIPTFRRRRRINWEEVRPFWNSTKNLSWQLAVLVVPCEICVPSLLSCPLSLPMESCEQMRLGPSQPPRPIIVRPSLMTPTATMRMTTQGKRVHRSINMETISCTIS